ncbi:MAG: hypothetical protein ACXVPQ_13690 [Bacteroidia bacterium]
MNTLPAQETNYLYDLSNPHFEQTELLTVEDKVIKGQFVQFKVVKGDVEYLYPAEKYCFVPEDKQKLFWHEYEWNQGAFKDFPSYVIQLSMSHIKKITISPVLVP